MLTYRRKRDHKSPVNLPITWITSYEIFALLFVSLNNLSYNLDLVLALSLSVHNMRHHACHKHYAW